MNQLDFLQAAALTSSDFNQRTEFLLPDFIAKGLITLIYADGGAGKSWLGLALARHCAVCRQQVYYLDFDNPLSALKERNVHNLLVRGFDNLHYLQRSKCQYSSLELLQRLGAVAAAERFANCVFVVDSLRNFVNLGNDAQVHEAMTQLMNVREAGATLIALHHSNKDGRNYQGANHIRNSTDNMYQLRQVGRSAQTITLHLTVQKERVAVLDKAFELNTRTLALNEVDAVVACMSAEQDVFVADVLRALTQPLNKTLLLEAVGRKKDDKTARGWLDQFDGVYWQGHKAGGIYTYTALGATAGSST